MILVQEGECILIYVPITSKHTYSISKVDVIAKGRSQCQFSVHKVWWNKALSSTTQVRMK